MNAGHLVNKTHLWESRVKGNGKASIPENAASVYTLEYLRIIHGECIIYWVHEVVNVQKSYNTPLEHTPGNPPTQLWKDSLYHPNGKGLGVCSKGVLKQP